MSINDSTRKAGPPAREFHPDTLVFFSAVFAILLVGVQLLPAQQVVQQGSCVATRDKEKLRKRQDQLTTTANALLKTLRDRDTKAFLRLIHPRYFSMGDGKNYNAREMERSFERKEELYCYLFDASCLPATAKGDSPETSFNSVANLPSAPVEAVQVWAGPGLTEPGCRGSVDFRWTPSQDANNTSTFTFMYVNRQWKTVGFDFPPSEITSSGAELISQTEAEILIYLLPQGQSLRAQNMDIGWELQTAASFNQKDFYTFWVVNNKRQGVQGSATVGYFAVNKHTAGVWDESSETQVTSPDLAGVQAILRKTHNIDDRTLNKFSDLKPWAPK